jgi:hypothetical protein
MRPLVVRSHRGLWSHKPFGDYPWESRLRAELKSMRRDAKERGPRGPSGPASLSFETNKTYAGKHPADRQLGRAWKKQRTNR